MPAAIPLDRPPCCEFLGCKSIAQYKVLTEHGRTQLFCKKHLPADVVMPKVTNMRQDLGRIRLKSTIPSNTEGDVMEVLRQLANAEVREKKAAKELKKAKEKEDSKILANRLLSAINNTKKEPYKLPVKIRKPRKKKPIYNLKAGEVPDMSRVEKNRGVSKGKPDYFLRVFVVFPDKYNTLHRHPKEFVEILPSERRRAKSILYEALRNLAPVFADIWKNSGSHIDIDEIEVESQDKKAYIGVPVDQQKLYQERLTKK